MRWEGGGGDLSAQSPPRGVVERKSQGIKKSREHKTRGHEESSLRGGRV